jgi:hypothetical protein
MADEPTTADESMTPDERAEAERFDAEPFDDVRAALSSLSDSAASPSEPMPDWVWTRLSSALAAESSARAAATHDNVVALPTSSAAPAEPRRFRWVGGLVAASVAILAITVGVQVMNGSSSGDLVAGGAAKAIPTAVAQAGGAPGESAEAAAQSAPQAFAAPAPSAATADSAEQPAKMVLDSNTKYTQAGLTGQVTSLLDRINVHSAREADQMPPQPVTLPVEGGFTSSWTSLRDCLTWLARSPGVQALVVDRGTFDGVEAGVIVIPADQVDPAQTPPPTATVPSAMGNLDVWVVDPSCQQEVDSIIKHLPYFWPR